MSDQNIIEVEGLRTQFGPKVIHENLDLSVKRGEIIGLVGGSGTGKSVLLREIIGLIKPAAGKIRVLGRDITGPEGPGSVRSRWGMLFQDGALFSNMTVSENIQVAMATHTKMSSELQREIACMKVRLVGLEIDAADKLPSQLSGGMRKRAGLARALALDPDLLFLDEPTAGLDPISASRFDRLIGDLGRALGLTVVMVTHDLDTLHAICERVAVLVDKNIKVGTIPELRRDPNPWIQEYFGGPRGRAVLDAAE